MQNAPSIYSIKSVILETNSLEVSSATEDHGVVCTISAQTKNSTQTHYANLVMGRLHFNALLHCCLEPVLHDQQMVSFYIA